MGISGHHTEDGVRQMKIGNSVARISFMFVAVSSLVACSGVKNSSEYKKLDSEVAALSKKVEELKSLVPSYEASIDEREQSQAIELATLEQQRLDRMDEFAGLLDEIGISKVISQFGISACRRQSLEFLKMQAVRDVDDPEYWAAVQKELDPAEVIFSIQDQGDDYPTSVNSYASQLAKTSCWRDGENDFYFDYCETVDRLQLKKNPEKFKGKCIRGSVRIAQLDANTGPCSFQGYLSGDYDVRAQFGTTLDTSTHSSVTDCDWTENLVEGKSIEFFGFGLGSYSYSTTSGGSQTVPAFNLVAWR